MKNRPYKKGTTVDETSTVLTMRTGPPAQDQQNFVRTSKYFQFLFRTI